MTRQPRDPKSLRLGITPWHLSSTMEADTLCRQAELAEQCGYESFWLPESHFAGTPSIPEPMLLLAAIAARTTSIKLGTTSYLLPIRNPLQAAEQVAVLDQLSGGRLILGLGRGFRGDMLDAFKVDPREKRQLFEQTLDAMKRAWSGDIVGSEEHAAVMSPLPLQQPHPPIWLAAFGPKALQQAAKLGVPYLASPMESLNQLEKNYRLYYDALDEHGKPRPQEVAVMRTVFISDDSQLCGKIHQKLSQMTSAIKVGNMELAKSWIVGNGTQVVNEIREYQQRLGMNYLIVARPRIKGLKPEACEQSMRQLAALTAELK
ncbi:MAG: LLM class flavin-dependent oxidoreductase [Proteobacteria bacterium]|nr:LLM class flavin-dependent oxidoreductase [Pseudomonadota bacterium]